MKLHAGAIQLLEHINLNVPQHAPAKAFYFGVLGCAVDPRRAKNQHIFTGTLWANIGVSQVHLPEGDPQVIPGTVGLLYPVDGLHQLEERLRKADADEALKETAFAWWKAPVAGAAGAVGAAPQEGGSEEPGGERQDQSGQSLLPPEHSLSGNLLSREAVLPNAEQLRFVCRCPYGNTYALYADDTAEGGGCDKRGTQPGPASASSGLAYVEFRVRQGAAEGIAQFYRDHFGAEAHVIAREVEGATKDATALQTAVVSTGPHQRLLFRESVEQADGEPTRAYDGHHICIYMEDEPFQRAFESLDKAGLIFVNPRPNYGQADTLAKAVEERQFRVKDMRGALSVPFGGEDNEKGAKDTTTTAGLDSDSDGGVLLLELEHEVRSCLHPSCPLPSPSPSLPT